MTPRKWLTYQCKYCKHTTKQLRGEVMHRCRWNKNRMTTYTVIDEEAA